jgi:putative flippase GtrA
LIKIEKEKKNFFLWGIINTIFGYTLFISLDLIFSKVFMINKSYFFSLLVARPTAVIFSYIVHSKFTFKKKLSYNFFFKFASTYIFTFILSLILLPIIVEFFNIHPWLANFMLIFGLTLISYYSQKYFVFR